MIFTESMLEQYAAPLSATEDQMCKNAIGMVRDALKPLGFTDDGKEIKTLYSDTYAYSVEMKSVSGNRRVKLFVQGSYANNTNVKTQSDVDIAVVQEEVFRTHYRSSQYYPQSDADYGFTTAPAATKTFKDEVQECLERKFGRDVERKNKSIKVHGNTYRKDAERRTSQPPWPRPGIRGPVPHSPSPCRPAPIHVPVIPSSAGWPAGYPVSFR